MLKNRIYNIKIPILIMVTVLFSFLISIFFLNKKLTSFKEDSIYYYNTIIEESIDKKIEISEDRESLFDSQAHYLMTSLSDEFEGIPLEDVNRDLLLEKSNKYGISGLCILKDNNYSATIVESTIPEEVGMGTESWGFWNTAIMDLFRERPISTDKGFAIDNFWIGPKTYSYVEKEKNDNLSFFKYMYMKNPDQNYMISGIISENDYIIDDLDLNSLLEEYENNIDFIDSVFIVNLDRLKNVDKNKEPFIVYGEDRLDLFPSISQKVKYSKEDISGNHSVKFKDNTRDFVLNKTSGNNYIITVLSEDNPFGGLTHTLLIIFAIFLLASYLVTTLIKRHNKRFQRLIDLESKRSDMALKLSKSLSNIPSYVFKCILDKDKNILVSFNEGRDIDSEGYLPMDARPEPIGSLYPDRFIGAIEDKLYDGFKGKQSQFEFDIEDKNLMFSVVPIVSDRSGINELMVTGIDVSKYVSEKNNSEHLAYHDQLTGLANRASFERDISHIISEGIESTLYYLDLDGFKAVNDNLGHDTGDSILMDFSKIISNNLEANMKLYRVGGDEFIILDKCYRKETFLDYFASKIKSLVASIPESRKLDTTLDVSLGISLYPKSARDKRTLVSKADEAMYESKKDKQRLFTLSR